MPRRSTALTLGALAVFVGIAATPAGAQYFGRNKVQYERFDFRVMETPHFDVYYYPAEHDAVVQAGRLAERWYERLSYRLEHRFRDRQPIVLYASPAHFRQTTIIPQLLPDGVGGLTDHLKGRVVLPFGAGLGETDHVLGHELVHAFQRQILRQEGRSIALLPLWFVEGMAEQLSIGKIDVNTAMWLRDAAQRDALPRIDQLDNPQWFPYRYGQALWAFLEARFGEDIVLRCLKSHASGGGVGRLAAATGLDTRALTTEWHGWIRREVADVADRDGHSKPIISSSNGGRLNVGPALSPDGKQVVFLSERDRYSIDVFVAEAANGRITRRLVRTAGDPHFDSLQFIDSAGAWDSTGQRFVLAAVSAGAPVLSVFEMTTGSVEREIRLEQLDQIFSPTWSPDGGRIAFSALKDGFSDIYVYDLTANTLSPLTRDAFADLQPAWSPDGRSLALVTDRFSSSLETLTFGDYRLATIDVTSHVIRELASFGRGKQIDPHWSADGHSLYFVADADGVSNVYRLAMDTGECFRVTRINTGVSGVTAISPSLSISGSADRMAYSVYRSGGYEIHVTDGTGGTRLLATSTATGRDGVADGAVSAPLLDGRSFAHRQYPHTLALDRIGQPYLSAGGGGGLGGFIRGGVSFSLGDMLGERQLHTAVQAGASSDDFALQTTYLNQRSRWNWAIAGTHVAWLTSGSRTFISPGDSDVASRDSVLFRQVHRQLSTTVMYPFSSATRIELGGGIHHIAFDYDTSRSLYSTETGRLLDRTIVKGVDASTVILMETGAALVRDTSTSGPTSPVLGERYRFAVTPVFGGLTFTGVTADYRRYLMPARPFTVAIRLQHLGRYGPDASDSRLLPLLWTLRDAVRGYGDTFTLTSSCSSTAGVTCAPLHYLSASRVVVGNAELRFPILGLLHREARYGALPLEGIVFGDGALFWSRTGADAGLARTGLRSAGVGVRLNAGGLLFEFDLARAFDRRPRGWSLAVNFRPGF